MFVNRLDGPAAGIHGRKFPLSLFLLLFVGLLFIGNRIDNDAWFLLNHGRYVDLYGFPHTEPFTMHEGLHFIMQQWLFAWILWKVYAFAGVLGLQAFAWLGGAVLIYLDYRLLLLVSGNRQMAFLMAQCIGVFCSMLFFCQRPQIVSSLLLLLEILVLETIPWGKKGSFAVLSVLSLLLINFHAAMWPMLFVFLLPYLAEWFGERGRLVHLTARFPAPSAWKGHELLLLASGMFLAAWFNPYGMEAMTYTAHSYGYQEINAMVSEMKPLSLHGFSGIPLLLLIGLFMYYARHRAPLRYFLLAFGTGILALSAIRGVFLFLLFGTLPLAYMLRNKYLVYRQNYTFQRLSSLLLAGLFLLGISYYQYRSVLRSFQDDTKLYLWILLFLAALLLVFLVRFLLHARKQHCFSHGKERLPLDIERDGVLSAVLILVLIVFPFLLCGYTHSALPRPLQRASEVLQAEAPAASVCLYTGYDTGPYLEFRGFPCYLDTRAEVFIQNVNQKKNILSEYYALQIGHIDYREFLSRYAFPYLLVDDNDVLYYYLSNDGNYECIWDASEDAALSSSDIAERNYRIYRAKE